MTRDTTPRTMPPTPVDDGSTFFELRFGPTPRVINTVRRFVVQFFESVLGTGDECSRLALATHELLENAVRHGSEGVVGLRVTVSGLDGGSLIMVRTRNSAGTEQIRTIREILAKLAGPRADAAYRDMMDETSQRTDGSGLGLARTRVEAEMELMCDEDSGEVHVIAQTFVNVTPEM